MDPDGASGGLQFRRTSRGQIRGECARGEPSATVGCHHQDHAVALGDGSRHGSSGEQGLIVRMGVDKDQGGGVRHGDSIVPYRPHMHVVHISDCFAPRTGGIETQVMGLVRAQQEAGDRVSVLTATPGPPVHGLEVMRLSVPMPFDLPVHPRTRVVVRQALRVLRPEVVHIQAGSISPFAWGALRAAHDLDMPTLVTVHSMWGAGERRLFHASRRLSWLEWRMQVAAVSNQAAQAIETAIPELSPVMITPNGIDPEPWRTSVSPDPAAPLALVSVMRLAPRKRVGALIEIFRALHEVHPSAHLTVVGEGPLMGWARHRAKHLPIAFVGRLRRPEMKRIYERSHMYVQPSIRESFGIAALEARCAGLPILAREQSGVASFIRDGIEGYLVPSDEAMVAFLRGVDPAELAKIREHNMTTTPPVTWADVLPLVQAGYLSAIAR
jgi:phosphatidylinositol alpha 1,6-mannosyltransferase